MSQYKGYRDLIVFQKSYKLAMEIFEITKSHPKRGKILINRSDQKIMKINSC